MTVTKAFREGVRRVNSAPAVLLGAYLGLLVLALPLAIQLRDLLRAHLGESMAAASMAEGVNYDWWQEFAAQTSGLGTTFTPSVIGFAAVLHNLSTFVDNGSRQALVATAAGAYILFWIFLAGGILDRYARNRKTRAAAFFSASGVYFFRFVRLAILAGTAYFLLFTYLHGWLLDDLYSWITHEFAAERPAFLVRLVLYGLFGAILIACNLVFDYAKIRAVVEDRRSMVGAALAALRFVWRHPGRTAALYGLDGLAFVLFIAIYGLVAPGAGTTGLSMWVGLLVGQVYLVGRLWLKLLFYASQTAYFQGELAHAEYTAAPQPVWPESPAAEAIANTAR